MPRFGRWIIYREARRRAITVWRAAALAASCALAASGVGPLRAETPMIAADETWAGLEEGEVDAVVDVIDGDTLRLASGLEVRLAEIAAPKIWGDGRDHPAATRFAEAAARTLEAVAARRTAHLYYGGLERDRHGRALAHVFLHDTEGDVVWAQARLVDAGLAHVASTLRNRRKAEALLRIEAGARRANRGQWADPWRALVTAENAGDRAHRFGVIEGVVRQTADVRGTVYLNFGEDYRTDFTIQLDSKALRLFRSEGRTPLQLQGRSVRVRGWVDLYNGPFISVTHPEQLEVLSPSLTAPHLAAGRQ